MWELFSCSTLALLVWKLLLKTVGIWNILGYLIIQLEQSNWYLLRCQWLTCSTRLSLGEKVSLGKQVVKLLRWEQHFQKPQKGRRNSRVTGTKPHLCLHFLCCDQLVLRLYPHGRGFSLISSTSARLIYLPNPDKTVVVSLVYFCGSVVSISWTSYRPVGSLIMCCNSLKFGLQFN